MPALLTLSLDLTNRPRIHPARLHGLACALTGSHGRGHTGPPFSVGPLRDHDGATLWTLGWLADHAAPAIPDTITLGPTPCRVETTTVEDVSYAELATSGPARHAHLEVVSPLYFSRNGRDHPLPDPVLIVRSAATRWNQHASAPLTVPEDDLRQLTAAVYLAGFAGQTVQAPVAATMHQTGFVGDVHLALTSKASTQVAALFGALIRYLPVCGAGAQTTHGFGATQLRDLT